ncbi:MAG: NAD(P)/FAD-dependent oxidoreductase, partial [Cyanobacteria bacterium P01_C01_bin.72]
TGIKKVAVVGAGMSGLTAAHRLTQNNLDVTLFEARDRIGGRIWTDKRLGFPLDLGASWIHGTNGNPIFKMGKELEQRLIPTGDDYIIRGRGGRKIAQKDAPDWLEEVISIQHSAGANLDQINQWGYLFVKEFGGADVIFQDGFADIFEALEGNYKTHVNTVVNEIRNTVDGVILGLDGKVNQLFDSVLVTVPLGVLKQGKINFYPELPARKRKAINRLGMGTLDKVYLLFDEPFWDLSNTWIVTPENDLPPGQFNQWLNLHRYIGKPVIMAFNGGPPALTLAALSDEEVVERALKTIYSAYSS